MCGATATFSAPWHRTFELGGRRARLGASMRGMELELRAATAEEYPTYQRVVETTFGHHPTDEELELGKHVFEPERSILVRDGGEVVATAGAYTFDLTLPGGAAVPVAGVSYVGVLATHRRRGILRRMMDHQLDDVAARGETIAVLTASESGIYGRFGYGLAAQSAWSEVDARHAGLAHPPAGHGRVRYLQEEEAAKVLPAVYEQARLRHPGHVSRHDGWWTMWLSDPEVWRDGLSKRFYVVHESSQGEPDGFLAYRVKEEWPDGVPHLELHARDLEATNDEAEAALLQFCLQVDLVGKVLLDNRPIDDPLRWRLAEPRRMRVRKSGDFLWLRVLDVAAALAARRYGSDDRITIELADRFRPANDGRWTVEGGADGADAARSDREPDLAMESADLGAIFLGGVRPSTLARAGRIVERTPGALRRADAFFSSMPAPWCSTEF